MVAAVPNYVGSDFGSCPPGHRFRLYLDAWKPGFDSVDNAEKEQVFRTLETPSRELERASRALNDRQAELAQARGNVLSVDARSTSPLVTGTGIEHPFENGFAFCDPHGVPVLAGSGVKGCLRRAAMDLDWPKERVDAYFGAEVDSGADEGHCRGAADVWDAYPVADRMRADIMNPHFTHYYDGGKEPSDNGVPNPIRFLCVPPGARVTFRVALSRPAMVPNGENWQLALRDVFAHAFVWTGFGAKTAIGYGRFEDPSKPARGGAKPRGPAIAQALAVDPEKEASRITKGDAAQRVPGLLRRLTGDERARFAKAAIKTLTLKFVRERKDQAWAKDLLQAAGQDVEH
jgi:CRISPR-associated protein Cmr6